MTEFIWIISSSLVMSAIALTGSITLLLSRQQLENILLPLVAFAAGTLLGGAFFYMLPAALTRWTDITAIFIFFTLGFLIFFILEQFLHWHHCRRASAECKKPLSYLILIGDALHNFLGGLAIASTFLIDIRLGIAAWFAAAMHEIPQELGDFAVLIHGGWRKTQALLFNFFSALTFLLGGLVAFFMSQQIDVLFLIPFAAGNFVYIAAADLIPEINKPHNMRTATINLVCFTAGIMLLLITSFF